MIQRFLGQLPDFARPTHPMMRHILSADGRRTSRRMQILRAVAFLLLLAAIVVMGYQLATRFGSAPLDFGNPLNVLFEVLFWPLIALQLLLRIVAMTSTSGVIAGEMQRGTWDTLKVTTGGAILALKTRWASVFYRLRLLLILLVTVRIVFIVIALINLTSFQGHFIDLLLTGTTPFGQPEVSETATVIIGIVILSMMMTAALLAPFTAVAFDAGIGMFIATLGHSRLISTLEQVVLIVVRVLLTAFALHLATVALSLSTPNVWLYQPITSSVPLGWLAAFFGISEGDMGLSLLHLPHVQQLWADRDYGVLVGAAFLGYVLLQAAAANALVLWAGRRAARADAL